MRKILKSLAIVFVLVSFAFGTGVQCFAENDSRFIDEAGLVSDAEALDINSYLEMLSIESDFDFVVAYFSDMSDYGYSDITEFADDYYDRNGFGYGPEKDGVILVVSMAERDYSVSTCGYGITALTDYGISKIEDDFLGYLSNGDYYQAAKAFAASANELVCQARNGEIYDNYGTDDDYYAYGDDLRTNTSFNWGSHIFIAMVVGIIAGVIVASAMKGKLTSVTTQNSASDYAVPGSMNLTLSNDIFLYANVAAVPKPKNPPPQSRSGGGGSSIHVSSGGVSHGGHSGKF